MRAGKVYPHEIGIQETRTNHLNLTVKRRYLTEREVERLMDCAHGRYGHRDANIQHTVRYTEMAPDR